MKIIYCHHALRKRGEIPTQQDGIEDLGIEDANIVAKLLVLANKNNNIKAIYTSPYYRCYKTAQIINQHINVPIFEDERLNEFDSKTEKWVDLQKRVMQSVFDAIENYSEQDTIVFVTSGVNVAPFILLAYGFDVSENAPFIGVPSCSPLVFDIKKDNKSKK